MAKRIINIISLAMHTAVFALGVILSITSYSAIGGQSGSQTAENGAEIIGAVIGSTIMTVAFALAVAYAFFAFIPMLLKLFRTLNGGKALDIFCIVFSVFLLFINITVAVATQGGGQVLFAVAAALSAATLVLNIISSAL